jgi:phosphoglycolate phosphatase-like HAD superfamily hydrolase
MLILDFDGVVCDAFDECLLVAWLGEQPEAGSSEFGDGDPPSPDRVPAAFTARFRVVRTFARTLDHFVVAHEPGAESIHTQQGFVAVFDALPQARVARFVDRAGATRAALRRHHRGWWLDLHALYPGIDPLLRARAGDIAIVTAKDRESVVEILARHGLDSCVREVVGDCHDKPAAVRDLCRRHGVDPGGALFVDDNLPNVLGVGATDVPVRWATWGYGTDEHRREARRLRVPALTLDQLDQLAA